jgi:hypothetical protein
MPYVVDSKFSYDRFIRVLHLACSLSWSMDALEYSRDDSALEAEHRFGDIDGG